MEINFIKYKKKTGVMASNLPSRNQISEMKEIIDNYVEKKDDEVTFLYFK